MNHAGQAPADRRAIANAADASRVLPAAFTSRRQFLVGSAAIAAYAGLVAAGCGGSDTGSSQSTTTLAKPSTKPESLTVRVWGGSFEAAFREGAGRTFTEETGIQLAFDRTPDNESFTQAQTAIRGGAEPPMDVSWSTSINGYLSIQQELLTPLNESIVTNLSRVNKRIAQPPDGSWGYVGIYGYSVPINYRSDLVDGGEFESWEALWDPRYEATIGLCDVIICTIGIVAKLAGVDLSDPDVDMAPVWDKYAQLRPNLAAVTTPEQLIQQFESGAAPILIDLAASGREAAAAGKEVDWATPVEGIPVDRDTFYVQGNIPEDRAYYGQVLINHVLEPANQEILAERIGVTPVNIDATIPAYQAKNPRLYPFSESDVEQYGVVVPTDVLAANQSTWQTEFDKAIKG